MCESGRVSSVHPNVTRVVEAARAKGLEIEPRNFGHAKTAIDAANVIGVDVGQIVKSLIFGVDGEIVLAYVSGANQLDERKLAAAAARGSPNLRMVPPSQVANLLTNVAGRSIDPLPGPGAVAIEAPTPSPGRRASGRCRLAPESGSRLASIARTAARLVEWQTHGT